MVGKIIFKKNAQGWRATVIAHNGHKFAIFQGEYSRLHDLKKLIKKHLVDYDRYDYIESYPKKK